MRLTLLPVLAFMALTNLAYGQAANYPAGSTVANFTVTDTDGNTVSLYTLTASGKYVMLDFFFDTCGPCQANQPKFSELYDKYGCNAGDLFCISINNGTDNNAEVVAYENTYGGAFHHAPAVSNEGGSSAVNTAFGVGAYPTFCLIGPDNKMVVNDIWPVANVGTFEAAFPEPLTPQACTFAGIETETLTDLILYPNPATTNAVLKFDAASATTATVTVYSMLGEQVFTASTEVASGSNTFTLDASAFAPGQYLVQLSVDGLVENIPFAVSNN